MADKTYALLELVHDRDSFIAFLGQLRDDWKDAELYPDGSNGNGWENSDIGAFLDAAHAWAENRAEMTDKDLTDRPLSQEPSWKMFAVILLMGKTYE